MDGYPSGSLDHNVPFLVACGLTSADHESSLSGDLKDQGILLESELPPLDTDESKALAAHFEKVDEEGHSWAAVERDELYKFRVKSVGRSYTLPPRHARLPETDEPLQSPGALHSPFSPLSTVSSLYPDGLINAQWIGKHQELIPSVFLCFHTLTTDPTTATLQDNRLKNDVAKWKSTLAQSGYRSRMAVCLMGDADSTPATLSGGLQERLENIRRGAGLEPKSLFYIPPQESQAELINVMNSILSALYTSAVEYYRDLGRHVKKKRSRGIAPQPTVPPTSGTSRSLALPEWNLRYDFKSAIFAEFRQEYDAAIRSFEQAYEIIFGPDVLDPMPNWSPRWNEGRLLSDIIAIRCLRLHFWMGHTSLAVRRWQAHRERVAEFVERRGRGTTNYGWEAWEARWAMVMANLMDKVNIQGLEPSTMTLFLPPEKNIMGTRIPPWEMLHHTGYWYRIAARHLTARKRLAQKVPDEDRRRPDESPASVVASNSFNYDTYMCPEPYQEYPLTGEGTNHSQLIVDCLIMARTQFQARKQLRIAAEISLECAKEMGNLKSWHEVLSMLQPLWEDMSYRSESWIDISEDMCWMMRRASAELGRGDLVVSIDWELMNGKFTRRPKWHYDLSKSLDGVSSTEKPSVETSDEELSSFIEASFVFRSKESRAGDMCLAQLALTSNAFPDAVPTALTYLRIEFDGALKPIVLENEEMEEDSENPISLEKITLVEELPDDADETNETPALLVGQCDLVLSPGRTRIIEMSIPLREAGHASASRVKLAYETDAFDFEYAMRLGAADQNKGWFVEGQRRPKHSRIDAHSLEIHPRPPKMEIKVIDSMKQYYANEPIELKAQLNNAEDETAQVKIDTHIFGKSIPSFKVQANDQEQTAEGAPEEARILGVAVGSMASSASSEVSLLLEPSDSPTTYDIHLRAIYHLESDPATPVVQKLLLQLNIVNAFEANYDLVPRLHGDPWPSLFDSSTIQEYGEVDKSALPAKGLSQRWCLICHYASFATEDIKVVGMDVKILSSVGDVRCNVTDTPEVPEEGFIVSPKTVHETRFDLVAQKLSLDDRASVSLDVGFVIRWQRSDSTAVNTTTMLAGHYLVLGSEPRVLASVLEGPYGGGGTEGPSPTMLRLDVTIENPSSHFLTFGVSMEPSDDFAFSGAKQTTLHLLPMTRRAITYRLLPLGRGGAYVRPGLVVRDKYFQKVLRIIPTEGMKIDREGLLVWVPPASEAESKARGGGGGD